MRTVTEPLTGLNRLRVETLLVAVAADGDLMGTIQGHIDALRARLLDLEDKRELRRQLLDSVKIELAPGPDQELDLTTMAVLTRLPDEAALPPMPQLPPMMIPEGGTP
jgi:hypothetical protein